MSQPFTDRVVIVLGGSGGIGAATCRLFAEAGASLVLTYRSDEAGALALAASLPGSGHLARRVVMEETATLASLAEEVRARFGRADVLVNSAGYTKPVPAGDLDALDDGLIDAMFQVNWRGPFAAIRVFRSLLEASGDGLVVNVSSLAALTGIGSNIAYAGSKAATDVMTKALARALAPKVRVMGVAPGVVATDFVPGRDASALEKLAPAIPLKRVATAEDCARAILACATHLTYSTGSTILVDGGRAL
jgi:3-oxoacyl-[acyl-carrier protein] reductase